MTTKRIEFAAREARNLVLSVRKRCNKIQTSGCFRHMTQLTVVGFSLGSHIASYACRYLAKETNEKVSKLIGEMISIESEGFEIFESLHYNNKRV